MIINAKYIHTVAESEGGEMEAMIGEEGHVHDHFNAKILASGMDQKRTTVTAAKQENVAMQYSCAGCLFNVV